jgi:exodeoxyribonuclease VII small subunit
MVKSLNYQEQQQELDAIVTWFETANPSIDEALAKYAAAETIIKDMEAYLKDAEAKIKLIVKRSPKE